jgi:hypothetical protein
VQLSLFHFTHDPSLLAFTTDAPGANLPPAFAPWTLRGSRFMSEGGIVGIANADAVTAAIELKLESPTPARYPSVRN